MADLSHMVDIKTADGLATQGAKASAALLSNGYKPYPTGEDLNDISIIFDLQFCIMGAATSLKS